jgi:hypothetical protein
VLLILTSTVNIGFNIFVFYKTFTCFELEPPLKTRIGHRPLCSWQGYHHDFPVHILQSWFVSEQFCCYPVHNYILNVTSDSNNFV